MTPTQAAAKTSDLSQIAPYVAPFLVFMLFLSVEGSLSVGHYLLYPVKALLVVVAFAWAWRRLPALAPSSTGISAGVGILGVLLWVGLDPLALKFNGLLESGYDQVVGAIRLKSWQVPVTDSAPGGNSPFALYPAAEAWALFFARLLGIALVVPVMEELFWRGFLMRWLIREDFLSVPLGTYRPFSFWATTALFASVHGSEWLLAVIVGVIYGAWFVRTKNLGNVMLAHGVTNALLALYCLFANDWHFLCPMEQVAPHP